MLTTGWRLRRSAVGGLAVSAIALLMTIPGPAAARPDPAHDADPIPAAADNVYLKDTPLDVGNEPHVTQDWVHRSPAIKICAHGITECPESIDELVIGNTYSVWITLHNAGTTAHKGVLQLRRTNPSGGTNWFTEWYFVNSTPTDPAAWIEVAPGVMSVRLDFFNVPGPGHFCLSAVWRSPTDVMKQEFSDMSKTVKENNNIAWRNVNSIDFKRTELNAELIEERPYSITNAASTVNRTNVVFTAAGTPFQNAGGQIVADLGPMLFQRWMQAGRHGTGIEQVTGTSSLRITSGQAKIEELTLNPGERLTIMLRFTLPTTFNIAAETAVTFPLSVTQGQPSPHICNPVAPCPPPPDRPAIGGVDYLIKVT